MYKKTSKFISLVLAFVLIFQQSGFAQVAAELNIASHLASLHSLVSFGTFRPIHLRYLQYNPAQNNFKLLLDKGDQFKDKPEADNSPELKSATQELLNYFFIGLTLPNESFWVNLRPDSADDIIDPLLAQTDIGKVLLEADLQLKKDTSNATNPQTPEGKEYWDKLYKKAAELYGSQEVTIPALTRPWIVPDEIIIRETAGLAQPPLTASLTSSPGQVTGGKQSQAKRGEGPSAYIYKATLKVMLEQDYLKGSAAYSFQGPREKQLNEYSSQLIRELIIPRLTKEINSSKRYASLRQVYYSLILAQWFKARNLNKNTPYSKLIDKKDLSNLQSQTPYPVDTCFKAYQDNFARGQYNIKEPAYTPYGQTIRSYFSGGFVCNVPIPQLGQTTVNPETGSTISSIPTVSSSPVNPDVVIEVKVEAANEPGKFIITREQPGIKKMPFREKPLPQDGRDLLFYLCLKEITERLDDYAWDVRQAAKYAIAEVDKNRTKSGLEPALESEPEIKIKNIVKAFNRLNHDYQDQRQAACYEIGGIIARFGIDLTRVNYYEKELLNPQGKFRLKADELTDGFLIIAFLFEEKEDFGLWLDFADRTEEDFSRLTVLLAGSIRLDISEEAFEILKEKRGIRETNASLEKLLLKKSGFNFSEPTKGWHDLQERLNFCIRFSSNPFEEIITHIIVSMKLLQVDINEWEDFRVPNSIGLLALKIRQSLTRLLNSSLPILTKRRLTKALALGSFDQIYLLRNQAEGLAIAFNGDNTRIGLVGRVVSRIHNDPSPQDLAVVRAYRLFVESKDVSWLNRLGYQLDVLDEVPEYRRQDILAACDILINSLEDIYGEGSANIIQGDFRRWQDAVAGQGGLAEKISRLLSVSSDDNLELESVVQIREALQDLSRDLTGEKLLLTMILDNRFGDLFYRQFNTIREKIDFSSPQEALKVISSLLANTRLDGYSPEELSIIEDETNVLAKKGVFNQEDWLKLYFIYKRIERVISSALEQTIDDFQDMAQKLALSANVKDRGWADDFSANIFRSDTIYLLSLALKDAKEAAMKNAGISGWQVVVPGEAEGRIRFIQKISELKDVNSNDIIVIERLPSEAPPVTEVAAIITLKEDSLLSHPAIRARQHAIPFAVCPDGSLLNGLNGQWVKLVVKAEEAVLTAKKEPAKNKGPPQGQVKRRINIIPADLGEKDFIIMPEDYQPKTVGNKSYRLQQIPFNLLPGQISLRHFGLSFSLFSQVLDLEVSAEIKAQLEKLKAKALRNPSAADIPDTLRQMRLLIERLRIPDNYLSLIMKTIGQVFGKDNSVRLFLRSSTNAEDLLDYQGAGLYDSFGNIRPESGEISKYIKKVWASAWNDRAFFDRQANGINHNEVFPAILAQEIVLPDYAFVIHTQNPADRNKDELIIELVQGFGESLVSGDEEFSGSPYRFIYNRKDGTLRLVSFDNKSRKLTLQDGRLKAVLASYKDDQLLAIQGRKFIQEVAKAALKIEAAFGYAQDIEGALVLQDGKWKAVFLQSRDQVLRQPLAGSISENPGITAQRRDSSGRFIKKEGKSPEDMVRILSDSGHKDTPFTMQEYQVLWRNSYKGVLPESTAYSDLQEAMKRGWIGSAGKNYYKLTVAQTGSELLGQPLSSLICKKQLDRIRNLLASVDGKTTKRKYINPEITKELLSIQRDGEPLFKQAQAKKIASLIKLDEKLSRLEYLILYTGQAGQAQEDKFIFKGTHIFQILTSSRAEGEIKTLIKTLQSLGIAEGVHIAPILHSSRAEGEIKTLIKILKDLGITDPYHITQILHSSRTEKEIRGPIKTLKDLGIIDPSYIAQILASSRTEKEINRLVELKETIIRTKGNSYPEDFIRYMLTRLAFRDDPMPLFNEIMKTDFEAIRLEVEQMPENTTRVQFERRYGNMGIWILKFLGRDFRSLRAVIRGYAKELLLTNVLPEWEEYLAAPDDTETVVDNVFKRDALHIAISSLGYKESKVVLMFLEGVSESEIRDEYPSVSLPDVYGKLREIILDDPELREALAPEESCIAPRGTPATLLRYMHKEKIFSDNPKKPAEMALKRGGNDSLSTIQKELRVLRGIGLAEGDGRTGYYLSARLKNTDPEVIIENNQGLDKPSPSKEEIQAMRSKASVSVILPIDGRRRRLLEMLKDEPDAADQISNWSNKDVSELLHILDYFIKGVALDPKYKAGAQGRYLLERQLVKSALPLINDPKAFISHLREKIKLAIKDKSVKFAIMVYGAASVIIAQGLIEALGLGKDNVIILYDDEIDLEHAERSFPGYEVEAFSGFNNKRAIGVEFYIEGDLRITVKNGSVAAILNHVPFKFNLPDRVSEEELAKMKEDLGIGQRKVIVLGTPSDTEFVEFMRSYNLLYGHLAYEQRPLVIVGFRQIRDEAQLKLLRSLSGQSIAMRSDNNIPLPDVSKNNVLVLNTIGELLKIYALADVAIVGSDRNIFKPASQNAAVLYFDGDWTNNKEAKEALVNAKAATVFSRENLRRLIDSPAEARKMAERGSKAVIAYKAKIQNKAEEFALQIIGLKKELRDKFISVVNVTGESDGWQHSKSKLAFSSANFDELRRDLESVNLRGMILNALSEAKERGDIRWNSKVIRKKVIKINEGFTGEAQFQPYLIDKVLESDVKTRRFGSLENPIASQIIYDLTKKYNIPFRLLIDNYPYFRNHFLLAATQKRQQITLSDLELVTVISEVTGTSWHLNKNGSGATQPGILHFQLYDDNLPFEKLELGPLLLEKRDCKIGLLKNYPGAVFVIESKDALIRNKYAFQLIDKLESKKHPFNLYYSSDKLYIIPRKAEASPLFYNWKVGIPTCAGLFIFCPSYTQGVDQGKLLAFMDKVYNEIEGGFFTDMIRGLVSQIDDVQYILETIKKLASETETNISNNGNVSGGTGGSAPLTTSGSASLTTGGSAPLTTSGSASSPSTPASKKGGVDFRYLPIVTQSMDSLKASIRPIPLNNLQRINLTREWSDIERLVNSGIAPCAERLKEYLAASCFKGNLDTDMDKIVSIISNILRMEEVTCSSTDPLLKDILVVLGSGRSARELKEAFSG